MTVQNQERAALREAFSRLAATLYTLDSESDLAFVRSQRGDDARRAAADADGLWERYLLAKERVEQATADDADGDATEAAEAAAVVAELGRDADRVLAAVRDLGARARAALADLDQAAAAMARIERVAAEVGVDDEPLVVQARAAVDRAAAAVAEDPIGAPPATGLRRALEAAEAHVDDLRRRRQSLPGDLAQAAATLDEIVRLADEGRAALNAAREKVLAPDGLLEPVETAALDAGDRGLRPWLARIQREAADGEWRAASLGLDRWREVASGWLANAEAVAAANRAPIAKRDELRSLLDAFQAKALASGRAEAPAVADLFGRAHDALHASPCDLAAAERAVREYIAEVNRPKARR